VQVVLEENILSKIILMPNTYTKLHIQFVFAVKYRMSLINKEWKEDLNKYITGIFQQNDHKMLQINSMPDHIHIFIGMRPHQSISSLVQNVKTEGSKWIKTQKFCKGAFGWQDSYGAFSYSKSHVPNVIRYIQNQEIHHEKETFLNEYRKILNVFKSTLMSNIFSKIRFSTKRSYGTTFLKLVIAYPRNVPMEQ
jgi:REP element-mobilizing transposase RayT